MKRTLTAATAVVVSSAGAVGLAGTAAAVTNPHQAPVQDPVDTSLAHTVGQGVDSVHKTVGDVVPAQPSAARAGGPQQTGAPEQHDPLGNTVSEALGGHGGNTGVSHVLPQGEDLGGPNPSGSNVAGLPLGGTAQPRSGGDASAETPPLVKPLAKVTQGIVKTDDKDGVVGNLARGVAGDAQSLAHGDAAAPRSGEPTSQPVNKNVDKLGPLTQVVGGVAQGDLAPAVQGVSGLVGQ